MIPKVIHYCWFGNNPLPYEVKECIKSWKKFCPNYIIKQWNENNFDVNQHPFIAKAYKEKAWAFVSDYARLKIIYDEGGIYLDTDVELLKSLNDLLSNKCYVGIQQQNDVIATGLGFGAEKHNKVVYEMLKQYDSITYDQKKQNEIACPWLNTYAIKQFGDYNPEVVNFFSDVTIYPPKYFDPLAPGNLKNLKCKDTYSIHHYSASWMKKSVVIRRKLIRIIGEEFIYKIKNLKRKKDG